MTILKEYLKKPAIMFIISVLLVSVLFTACYEDDPSTYTALTEDDVALKMLRYRPAENVAFNENRQPILLIGGMGMNINEFLPHTTDLMKDVYADMELPDPLPDWAVGDEYIQNDPLLLYNIGHYFWLKGYDPWFGNLRGIGRDPQKSEKGIKQTNIDVFGCLDVPAFVDKITEVTGMKPIIGGHSTGSTVCYMYLTGAYMDIDEVMDGKNARPAYIPHVKISADLAIERNNAVNGFIALDPGSIPPLPGYLDFKLMWNVARIPIVLPLDFLMEKTLVDSGYTGTLMSDAMNVIFTALSNAAVSYEALEWLHFFETKNMDPYVRDYYFRYAVGNIYMGIVSQFFDWGMHSHVREHYKNGAENIDLVEAPPRATGDGYTYYEDHMINITTPTICALSDYDGLVATQTVIDYIMESKTPHPMDEYFIMEGTAHADLPCGRTVATELFPKIGQWLDQM